MEKLSINGVEFFPFSCEEDLFNHVNEKKGILVAINAEKIINATDKTRCIINKNIGYIDGAGAMIAAHKRGFPNACKIPGCELWLKIIARFYKEKTFYLVGGKQPIIEQTVEKLQKEFEGINIVGYRNGYIKTDEDKKALGLWAATLKDIGFDKRISLEAGLPDTSSHIECAAKAADLMKVFR